MAARGGLEDEPFPWGDADHDPWTRLNSWEGEFPDENSARDGFVGPGPVDAYAPNAFGIYNALYCLIDPFSHHIIDNIDCIDSINNICGGLNCFCRCSYSSSCCT